jgi:hypothetical protein
MAVSLAAVGETVVVVVAVADGVVAVVVRGVWCVVAWKIPMGGRVVSLLGGISCDVVVVSLCVASGEESGWKRLNWDAEVDFWQAARC